MLRGMVIEEGGAASRLYFEQKGPYHIFLKLYHPFTKARVQIQCVCIYLLSSRQFHRSKYFLHLSHFWEVIFKCYKRGFSITRTQEPFFKIYSFFKSRIYLLSLIAIKKIMVNCLLETLQSF